MYNYQKKRRAIQLSNGATSEYKPMASEQHLRQVLEGTYIGVQKEFKLPHRPPFCIVAVLSNVAGNLLVEKFTAMVEEMRAATKHGFPLYVQTYIMEEVSSSFRTSLRSAFQVNGKFSIPSFYVTVEDPEDGFRGNLLDWTKLKNDKGMHKLRKEIFNTCLHASHMMSRRYTEVGETTWWKDPAHEGLEAMQEAIVETHKPNETLEERSKRLREESLLKFEKAKQQGYEVAGKSLQKAKTADPLVQSMLQVLNKDGDPRKKHRKSAEKFLDAVEAGSVEKAAGELIGNDLEAWQKACLLEAMDTATPDQKKFAEKMIGRVESVTATYLHNIKVEINDLLKDIRQLKKNKKTKRDEVKARIRERAARLSNMPIEWLNDPVAAVLNRGGGLKEMFDRNAYYMGMASKTGRSDFKIDWRPFLLEMVAEVIGTGDPVCHAMKMGAKMWTIAKNIPIAKSMLSDSLLHMSATLHLDEMHAQLMTSLASSGGVLESIKDVIDKDSGKTFKSFMVQIHTNGYSPESIEGSLKHFYDVDPEKAKTLAKGMKDGLPDGQCAKWVREFGDKALEGNMNTGRVKTMYEKLFSTKLGLKNTGKIKDWFKSLPSDAWSGKKELLVIGGDIFTAGLQVYQQHKGLHIIATNLARAGDLVGLRLPDAWIKNVWTGRVMSVLSVGMAVGLAVGFVSPVGMVVANTAIITTSLKLAADEVWFCVWTVASGLCLAGCTIVPKKCKYFTELRDGCIQKTLTFGHVVKKHGSKVATLLAVVSFVQIATGSSAAGTWGAVVVGWLQTYSGTGIAMSYVGIAMQFVGNLPVLAQTASIVAWCYTNVAVMAAAVVLSPTFGLVVGTMAVGGIARFGYKKYKGGYKKTKKHLRAGGNILLPSGWRMFMHDDAETMWFANSELGRLQNVFPTGTRFVDVDGRRTAHMTIEFGIMRPTKIQKHLAAELGEAVRLLTEHTRTRLRGGGNVHALRKDARRVRRVLTKWQSTRPRNGARLLVERHVLQSILGDDAFQRLVNDKVLRLPRDDAVAVAVLEELSTGRTNGSNGSCFPSKNVLVQLLRDVGRDTMYHSPLSLQQNKV